MSETTKKLRAFGANCEAHKPIDWYDLFGGLDLAADAIEAVEARAAAAEARIAAVEKRTVAQIPQERPACTGEDAETARGSIGAAAHIVPNAEGGSAGSTSPAAPTAVQAPRGFRVGDRVKNHRALARDDSKIPEEYTGTVTDINETWLEYKPDAGFRERGSDDIRNFTLIALAADAPADPDPALVERVARAIYEGFRREFPINNPWDAAVSSAKYSTWLRDARSAISALTAESRLCAPGEVDDVRATVVDLRAKLESAETHGDLWKKHADAHAAERDHWRARAESAERNLAEAESDRDAAFSKETALRIDVRAWQDAAMEARGERDEFKRKLAAAEQALDVERRTLIVNASGGTVVAPTRDACLLGRKDFHATLAAIKAERDALRAELDEAKKWRDEFKRIGQKAEEELDALKAKPRFRTRKVRAADLGAYWTEIDEGGNTPEEQAKAMNAVGLRMKVKP